MKYQTKEYVQNTLLILVITAIVSITLFVPLYNYQRPDKATSSINVKEQQMIDLTNEYRLLHSLNALTIDNKLMDSAQVKANDLCTSNNWGHNNSKDQPFYIFIQQSGYIYAHAGENLAKGYSDTKIELTDLTNSPSHLENIVGDYDDIGVGFNDCGGKKYVAIHYGKRLEK
jgi:uncharacterized protein YkwD